MTTTTEQHSPVFLTIGEQIQTFPLKFPYETHGKRFIVYCRVMDALRRLRIAKLTTTRGITNSLLTSLECSIGIWSTLALLNLIRRIFLLCCKEIKRKCLNLLTDSKEKRWVLLLLSSPRALQAMARANHFLKSYFLSITIFRWINSFPALKYGFYNHFRVHFLSASG